MKKIFDFLNRYGVIIIVTLLLVLGFRNCAINSNVKKTGKKQTAAIEVLSNKIDSLSASTVTTTDLKIEGLKAEKRAIEACDRKKFDLERENEINKEIAELEKNMK